MNKKNIRVLIEGDVAAGSLTLSFRGHTCDAMQALAIVLSQIIAENAVNYDAAVIVAEEMGNYIATMVRDREVTSGD